MQVDTNCCEPYSITKFMAFRKLLITKAWQLQAMMDFMIVHKMVLIYFEWSILHNVHKVYCEKYLQKVSSSLSRYFSKVS